MQPLPEGLWPVMLTPFKANNEVDHAALRRLTDFYLNAGSTGLFANCLSSEMFQLTGEERLAVTKTVVEAAGKVPVVSVGSFGSDTQINADFIKQIYDTGVAAVVISTSQICAQMESNDVLKKRFEDLLQATGDIPLGLYECPVPYKRLLSPEMLGWLAHTGRFLYHKDTCCDLEILKQKIAATQGTPMGIYNAHMPTGVASIQSGARGLSPIGANLYPELLSYLADNANKYNGIPAKLEATLSLMDTQIHHNYPYTAKLFLQKRGLDIHAEGRTPRGEMTAHDYDKLDAMYLIFEQLCFEYEIVFENSIPKQTRGFMIRFSTRFWLFICAFCYSATVLQAQPDRPNILFIYTDDQAPWALGISGDPNAHTPNLDQLAKEGAYLKNSFVTTPVCSPARVSIMTSQYASEYQIYDFIAQPGHKLYDPENPVGLDPKSITFAEILQKAGYTTGLVGKWHLGDWIQTKNKQYHPTNHGFDYFMGLTGGGTSPDNPPLEKDGVVKEFEGLTTNILTDHAIEFIEKNAKKPFLLCLNYRAPHGRWLPVAPEDWAPYEDMDPVLPNPNYPDLDTEKAKRKMREYLASTSGVDRSVGRLMALLKELGIEDNTIVIFTSDHGYNMGHNGIEHKGNGVWITKHQPEATENIASKYRPNLYDNSLRVPAIVRWPGQVKPGTVITKNTRSLDWYPTIVEMAGSKIPKKATVRGHSLVPMLKGEEVKDWNNDVYSEYSMINYCQAHMRSYRTDEWKLVRDFLNPERDELYHIALDPEENINLISDCREQVKEVIKMLDQKITEQMEALNDPLLKGIFPK